MSENTRFVNYKTNKLLEELIAAIRALQITSGGTQPIVGTVEVGAGFKEPYIAPTPPKLKGENEVI